MQFQDFKNEDEDPSGIIGMWEYSDTPFGGTGGMSITLEIHHLTEFLPQVKQIMKDLYIMDSQTAIVEIEFVLYNGHYDLFTYVYIKFETFPSGYVIPYLKVSTINISLYQNSTDYVRAFLEVVLILMYFFYSAVEIV